MSIITLSQQHLEAIFHLCQFFVILISCLFLKNKQKHLQSLFTNNLQIISKTVECINVLVGSEERRC